MVRAMLGLSLLFSVGACVATSGGVEPSGGGQFKASAGATTAEGATAKAVQAAQAHCAESGKTPEMTDTTATSVANSKWARVSFRCV
jgi:hypothetical protein